MGIVVATTRVAADIAGGNQDITADLGGLTPAAAYFIVTRAVADGVPADHAIMGVGAATAADECWAVSCVAENAQGTTDTGRIGMTDKCIVVQDVDGTIDGEAEFVSSIVNGVRINWTVAPAAAYLMPVVLFAGTDLSALACTFTAHVTQDSATDVDLGFEPDVVLTATHGAAFDDNALTQGYYSLGVVTNETGGVQQHCHAGHSGDNEATSLVGRIITSSYGTGQFTCYGTWLWAGEFGDLDADGFSCTSRLAGGGGDQVSCLALAFGGAVDFWSRVIDTPIATGNQSQVGPEFTPQFVMCGLTQMPAIDTAYTDANAGSVGISVFDADEAYCNSIQDEDGQAASDTQSLSDDQVINFPDDDGTAAHVATFVGFVANGWTWDFSVTEGTAVKWWALAIEEEAAAPGGQAPRSMHQFRMRRAD